MRRLLLTSLFLVACGRQLGPATGWGVGVVDGGGPSTAQDDRKAETPAPPLISLDATITAGSTPDAGEADRPALPPVPEGPPREQALDASVDTGAPAFAPGNDVQDAGTDTGDARVCPEAGRCD